MTSQPIEKIVVQSEGIEDSEVYSRFRVVAAAQFSIDIVRGHQTIVRNPPPNPRLKSSDKFIDPIMAPIAPYLCYIAAPSAFIYGLFALRYSQQRQGHIIE